MPIDPKCDEDDCGKELEAFGGLRFIPEGEDGSEILISPPDEDGDVLIEIDGRKQWYRKEHICAPCFEDKY